MRNVLKVVRPILDTNSIRILTTDKIRREEISVLLKKLSNNRKINNTKREEAEKNKTEYGNTF